MEQMENDWKDYAGSLADKKFESAVTRGRRYRLESDEEAIIFGVIDPFVIDAQKIKNSKFFGA